MIAIDTNVLVRLLTGDHPGQPHALRLRGHLHPGHSPAGDRMGPARRLRSEVGRNMHGPATSVRPAQCDGQRRASHCARHCDWHEAGFDFADTFHLALRKGRESMKTFDADFIKNAKKLTDRLVERP